MKRSLFAVASCLLLFLSSAMAAEKVSAPAFWGTISSVDAAQKTMTVLNKKRKTEQTFVWTDATQMTNQKSPMTPAELAVGQFLKVTYMETNNKNIAQTIAVRKLPFKKKE